MNGIDIAVIVCVSVLVVAALAYLIYRKVKHKGDGCCGSCSECGMCAHASKDKKPAHAETDAPACPHCKKE